MKRSKTLLNLRSKPTTNSSVLGQLLYGEPMIEHQSSDKPGWSKVKAKVKEGGLKEGFVSSIFLRDSVSEAKEKLMYNTMNEWKRFDYGKGEEHKDPYYKYVGEMWKSIGSTWDGQDRDVPWSAAFISYVVKNAGSAYSSFRFASAHARYIHDSIKKRNAGTSSPFWGYRLSEKKPQLGDMVCAWRETKVDYDYASKHNAFKSHCDIIIEVKSGNVKAIGGNVSDSVNIKSFSLDSNGYLKDSNKVFALLKNNN